MSPQTRRFVLRPRHLTVVPAVLLLAACGSPPTPPPGVVRTYDRPPAVVVAPAVSAPSAPVMHTMPDGTTVLGHPGAIVTSPAIIPPPPPSEERPAPAAHARD